MELCEQIFEVRYKPNSKILDYRGGWAAVVSDYMKLPEWQILENRIDVYDSSRGDHAFIGFRNSGFVSRKPPTKNYFHEQTAKLLNYLALLKDFSSELFVERIGVRSRFCPAYEQDFETLKKAFETNYLCLTAVAKQKINATMIDIGAPLNFVDDVGNFNTNCGPMKKEQISQFFGNVKSDDIPKVGLYYDIDYFTKPTSLMKIQDINAKVKAFAEKSWERYENTKKLIMGH